jgi:broad specificity phosphatase PhoE
MSVPWRIPQSVLEGIARVPKDRPVALLLRHSVREALPSGHAGYVLPITPDGERIARELGALLQGRIGVVHTSPLVRCRQTAEAIRVEASPSAIVVDDRLLGDPGVFVVDEQKAGALWERIGHEAVMAHLCGETTELEGLARPEEAAWRLVRHMLAASRGVPGIHVFVTHDSLVGAVVSRFFERRLGRPDWPWFLEGAFFWEDAGLVTAHYRGEEGRRHDDPASALSLQSVVELARWEIATTLGTLKGTRFFLAGGVFKTLLTGRPPRDLDLWAPSARDRERLVSAAKGRGAREVGAAAFADRFELTGRIVELPRKAEPPTLEARLARFDIALSAIGVEHAPDGHWSAAVHERARASVERRHILLLKPLVNTMYALATLERMRRYAEELRFAIPPEEEAEVWRVFDAQPANTRREMLARFEEVSMGGYGVRSEAVARLG